MVWFIYFITSLSYIQGMTFSLQVHRSQGGELETTVEISGEPEAREKAREMIEEIVTPIKDITDKLSGTV